MKVRDDNNDYNNKMFDIWAVIYALQTNLLPAKVQQTDPNFVNSLRPSDAYMRR